MNYSWLIKMAWRDSRKNRSRLLLFMSSIILGIAALVAINSFGDNMQRDIQGEANKLLGADLVIEGRQPFSEEVLAFMDSLSAEKTEEISFASMVLFPKTGGSRLVEIRAMEGGFPYYGAIETMPTVASQAFRTKQQALADQTLMLQYDAVPGDSVRIGSETFAIAGRVTKVPGQAGIATSVAPPVFIPLTRLEATGLLQKGSRINYKVYYKFQEGTDVNQLMVSTIEPRLEKEEVRFDTVEERKQEVGDTYANLTGFLNLVAFVALLLGCIGVASSVHIYVKGKVASVAILRCLGVTGSQSMAIYLLQIAVMGLAGSAVGAAIGAASQLLLPQLFADFLPVEVQPAISWSAIGQGILLGLIISVLFALLPLMSIRNIAPLTALRASYEAPASDKFKYVVYGLIVLFIAGFSLLQLDRPVEALWFTGGILLAFLLLTLIARLLSWAVKTWFPVGWSYIWRQSLANLYRPNNQTLVLMTTIGLGTALVTTLFFVQDMLLQKVERSGSESQANMVLFDIQSNQVNEVMQMTRQHHLPVVQQVPVVTMRLEAIKGKSTEAIKADTTLNIRSWTLNREYRVTYRDSLIDSEELLKGSWRSKVISPGDSIFVSLEDGIASAMQVDVGDKITFNVQGALMDTYVGSIRKVDWQRVQTNFLVLFPEGVLERAPKFHVVMTRVDSAQAAANFQRDVVQQFPNISIIDLNLILQTLDDIIGKVSFVIQFMAFLSIITGVIVLIGSVVISKYQRVQESVLLRTMGASRRQILRINALEYLFLGSLAALTGVVIALLGSWALAVFSFDMPFVPSFLPMLGSFVIITVMTILIGLANSRSILNRPPLEILRHEA